MTLRVALLLLACSYCARVLALPAPAPAPVVTEEQYEKSIKMLRNVCVPKTGMTQELLDRLKSGELVEDKTANCYLACIMSTVMVLKNNKVDGKMFRLQSKKMMLPEDATRTIAAFDICEPQVTSAPDQCDTVFSFIKCMKTNDPLFKPPA